MARSQLLHPSSKRHLDRTFAGALGFKWEAVGARPQDGVEIANGALSIALQEHRNREFTWVELDQFGLEKDLRPQHYVMVGDTCFLPRGRDWQPPPCEDGEEGHGKATALGDE